MPVQMQIDESLSYVTYETDDGRLRYASLNEGPKLPLDTVLKAIVSRFPEGTKFEVAQLHPYAPKNPLTQRSLDHLLDNHLRGIGAKMADEWSRDTLPL
jgi:hypothetical protein